MVVAQRKRETLKKVGKSRNLLSQVGTLNREAYASLAFIRPPMAPLTAYGTYGLWHQLRLFTCGVTLVGTMVLYLCPLCMFRNDPFGNKTLTKLVSEWRERGVLSYLIQPHPHSVVIQTPSGLVDPRSHSRVDRSVLQSSFAGDQIK